MSDPITYGLLFKRTGMSGIPPRDLQALSAQSTDSGIKLTFTPPKPTYLAEHTSGDGTQFACMPAGILIKRSTTGYPRKPNEGTTVVDWKPTGDWTTAQQTFEAVGLTFEETYYFTAFPYSTEGVYNKSQASTNRVTQQWVGNKGTISVNVKTPEGYVGTLGQYTITLVDQASASPQNVEKTATGAGLTQFGGLTAGKSYKVRLSSTDDLQAPPDSEVVTIVGGVNYDVTMTYAIMYGTITVNVSTQPAGMPIGQYTVTLTPNDSTEALTQQGNNSQAVVFNNVKNGVVYTVGLSAINHYTANAGGTVTAVGGQNISHNVHYEMTDVLNNFSWAEIDALSQAGVADDCWSVGDTKDITVGSETITMEIWGFNHDDLATGGKAGITFGMRDLMANTRQMNTSNTNVGGFTGSAMYSYLNTTLYNQLPAGLRSVIKQVNKKTSAGNTSTTVNTDAMRLWLPSLNEVYGSHSYSWCSNNEGSKYSIFTNDASRIKNMSNGSGSALWWWLRSPYLSNSTTFCGVNGNGYVGDTSHASGTGGVCLGFCV